MIDRAADMAVAVAFEMMAAWLLWDDSSWAAAASLRLMLPPPKKLLDKVEAKLFVITEGDSSAIIEVFLRGSDMMLNAGANKFLLGWYSYSARMIGTEVIRLGTWW